MASPECIYVAIDLKSFYASVECVERNLNPLDTNLVVADESRTDKTICLAVTPTLKACGISGRPRLFEVRHRLKQINSARLRAIPDRRFKGKSYIASELRQHPDWEVDLVIAPPRMAHYIEYSTRIYQVYLQYVAPEDVHVYSIDEVFINLAPYLTIARATPHDMAMMMIRDVLSQTGVTATAGIGTNLYLAKVAMDIVAKHMEPDSDGVRIASLDEMSYRHQLWTHQPLTDFWRVGRGTASRLAQYGIHTMGDIARASLEHEGLLYQLFGVNAELLIDHAWGWEPTTIDQIRAYKPQTHSICSGQVLTHPYTTKQALVVALEMAEGLSLELLSKGKVTDMITLDIGYDVDNLKASTQPSSYQGAQVIDRYGRATPKPSHGSCRMPIATSSLKEISQSVAALFERTVNHALLVRRLTLTANNVIDETASTPAQSEQQLNLFTDYDIIAKQKRQRQQAIEKERRMMKAAIEVKQRFGKNALLRGLSLDEVATLRERNQQIGGHKA